MAGEKTEQATPKRRQDERKKGNVFQSNDVVSVISLVVMFYSLEAVAPFAYPVLKKSFSDFFQLAAQTDILALDDMKVIFIKAAIPFVVAAVPLLLISCAMGIVLSGIQTRFIFNMDSLKFKANRLNPLSGLKKMVSLRGLVEL
ncbi:MAG: EscU/YscU/HrcU family type III secretion system export apparatus switch protein, partial [Oscillospiraceae bacterium]